MKKLPRQLQEYKRLMLPDGSPPQYHDFAAKIQAETQAMEIQAAHDRDVYSGRVRRWQSLAAGVALSILLIVSIPTARAFVVQFFQGVFSAFGIGSRSAVMLPQLTHEDVILIRTQSVNDATTWMQYDWKGETLLLTVEPNIPFFHTASTDEHQTGTIEIPGLDAQAEYYTDKDGIFIIIPYKDGSYISASGPGITDLQGFLDIVATLEAEY